MMTDDIIKEFKEFKPVSKKQKRGEFNLDTLIDAGIFSETWKKIMFKFYDNEKKYNSVREVLGFSFDIIPFKESIMSTCSNLFELDRAQAMHIWYASGERDNDFITQYFPQYRYCIDDDHKLFNSNYGYYAYSLGLLDQCIMRLANTRNTRQACFCINNNEAMSYESIDKLCTNSIMFFIREDKLEMFVQMRSSNILTLLPYDIFMFSKFYEYVLNGLNALSKEVDHGNIHMQIGSAHYYSEDVMTIVKRESYSQEMLSSFFKSLDVISSFMKKSLKNVKSDDNCFKSQNILVDLSNIKTEEENGKD